MKAPAGHLLLCARPMEPDVTDETRLRRIHYRAWHRGTREADYIVGGFFDAHGATWDEAQIGWFEALLDEQDVDIVAWAMGTDAPPARLGGAMMEALRRLDYVLIPR
jgi:antitoxin CptB